MRHFWSILKGLTVAVLIYIAFAAVRTGLRPTTSFDGEGFLKECLLLFSVVDLFSREARSLYPQWAITDMTVGLVLVTTGVIAGMWLAKRGRS